MSPTHPAAGTLVAHGRLARGRRYCRLHGRDLNKKGAGLTEVSAWKGGSRLVSATPTSLVRAKKYSIGNFTRTQDKTLGAAERQSGLRMV